MYISIRKRKSKKTEDYSCYFYLCLSHRENGKVKTQQHHFATMSESEIFRNTDAQLKNQTIYSNEFLRILRKEKIEHTYDDIQKLWENICQKLEKIRQEIIDDHSFRKKHADYRNNNNSNDSTWDEYFKYFHSSNYNYNSYYNNSYNNCNYTDEEKDLFKQMFKDMAKKYHPDISKDDGSRMKLLLKIKEDIMS